MIRYNGLFLKKIEHSSVHNKFNVKTVMHLEHAKRFKNTSAVEKELDHLIIDVNKGYEHEVPIDIIEIELREKSSKPFTYDKDKYHDIYLANVLKSYQDEGNQGGLFYRKVLERRDFSVEK